MVTQYCNSQFPTSLSVCQYGRHHFDLEGVFLVPGMNFSVEAEEKMPRAKQRKRSLQTHQKDVLPKKRQRKSDIETDCSVEVEVRTEEVRSY